MADRIEILTRMLAAKPDDTRLRFGLALEYLGLERWEDAVRELETYLAAADDEGNAWGRLAHALERLGRIDEAVEAYRRGIEASERHGHPTMADEFREALAELQP